MGRIENTIVIDRSIEEIWPFFASVDNIPTWYPGIHQARQTSDGPLGKGATIAISGRVGPVAVSSTHQVTDFEPHRSIELRLVGGSLAGNGLVRLDLDGVGSATRVTITSEIAGLRALLFDPLGKFRGAKRDEFFANLKRVIEERPSAAAEAGVGAPIADTMPPEPPVEQLLEAAPDESVAVATAEPAEPPSSQRSAAETASPQQPAAEPARSEEAAEMPVSATEEKVSEPNGEPAAVAPVTPIAIGDRLVLRLQTGREPEPTFEVERSGATLGRSQENTIRLDDLSVSRRHARIAFRQGRYWLSDVGSTSGTWVDGTRLNAPKRVARGQVIDIGLCRLTVEFAAGADGNVKDEVTVSSEVAGHGRRRR